MTHSGQERAGFAAMHGPNLLYFHAPWVWGQRDEAAQLHGTARRHSGNLAGRGTRAADWQGSNNPDSYRGHVLGLGPLDCTFCGIAANMMPAIKSRGSHPIR